MNCGETRKTLPLGEHFFRSPRLHIFIKITYRGNRTLYPGRWIYPAFNNSFLTLVFAVAHFVLLPFTFLLITMINGSPAVRVLLKCLGIVSTPFLYIREYGDSRYTEFVVRIFDRKLLGPPAVLLQTMQHLGDLERSGSFG